MKDVGDGGKPNASSTPLMDDRRSIFLLGKNFFSVRIINANQMEENKSSG
jgi:hypothetical protein